MSCSGKASTGDAGSPRVSCGLFATSRTFEGGPHPILLHIITYFNTLLLPLGVAASARCPPAAAWRVRPNDYDRKAVEATEG